MLSICITTRNTLIEELVTRLCEQAKAISCQAEICVMENSSEKSIQKQNERNSKTQNIRYFFTNDYLSHNKMRNQLADKARGSYILFLKGDNHITHKKYLNLFEEVMQPGMMVHGGITASGVKPAEAYQLHWQAMHNLLSNHSDDRNEHPYFHLNTDNLMGPRGLFLQFPFPENDDLGGLLPYSFELKRNKIPVIHIDNPVSTSIFLSNKRFLAVSRKQMSQTAIWLEKISEAEKEHINLAEYTHLKRLQKFKLFRLFMLVYRLNTQLLVNNITRKKSFKLGLYRNFRRRMLGEYLK